MTNRKVPSPWPRSDSFGRYVHTLYACALAIAEYPSGKKLSRLTDARRSPDSSENRASFATVECHRKCKKIRETDVRKYNLSSRERAHGGDVTDRRMHTVDER